MLGLCIFAWVQSSYQAEVYKNSPEGRAEAARQQDQFLIELDQGFVQTRLRDPDSAQFMGSRVVRKGGEEGVCGYVNSRNGFGGMAGSEEFAVIGVEVLFASEGREAYNRVDSFCDHR